MKESKCGEIIKMAREHKENALENIKKSQRGSFVI